MADFFEKLNATYDTLTRSHKRVADYVKENLSNVAFSTLDETATQIGVSTTTVVRFSRAIGCNGYSEMQKDIQNLLQKELQAEQPAENLNQNSASLSDKTPMSAPPSSISSQAAILSTPALGTNDILSRSFQQDMDNLAKTMQMQKPKDLESSVQLLLNAPNVFILGMRSSFSAASYMACQLGMIRKNVRLIQNLSMSYPEEIIHAQEGDVCIAYLFPRYSKVSASILSWLKNEGVQIILITSPDPGPVKGYGNITLPCAVSSTTYENSMTAPLALSNYLVTEAAKKAPSATHEILEKKAAILEQGFYLSL